MDVVIEKKMTKIEEPVVVEHYKGVRSVSPPTELEPSEEFPILYGLLTAPKSFKPKNSEELQALPHELRGGNDDEDEESRLADVISMEEADSQNLDFRQETSFRSESSSPQTVDSSSNLSSPDENDSPIFLNYLRSNGGNSHGSSGGESSNGDFSEDESSSVVCSPGGSSSGGDECADDNIPTSTTSGFRRKATRLETAIGNIVRRRRVQKRSSPNNNSNTVSMAPSSPTVSTTCVDPSPPPQRGRSEILERILRSTTTNTVNNLPISHHQLPSERGSRCIPVVEGRNNDSNNNECGGGHEPYAKLRDLLTMPEDQLVKRRRLEFGLPNHNHSNNKSSADGAQEQVRPREFSPPRNNILASLLQKGRPYEPPPRGRYPFESRAGAPPHVSINLKYSDNNQHHPSNNGTAGGGGGDDRPYKCSLCDLRFKKLPLLNRHVKTHSHIKRYVCRFCSHAFKRSDNLLAHMRTSCKGIKESDARFAIGVQPQPPKSSNNNNHGQLIPALLSPSPPSPGLGQIFPSPIVSRSQLEEALLNFRAGEKLYTHSPGSSPLVSTTTESGPSSQGRVSLRQIIQPGPDFQSRHSKLLEILSGSPVVAAANEFVVTADDDDEEDELPLSLKVERSSRCVSPHPSLSPSSSSQSQFRRSHQLCRVDSNYLNQNELPNEDGERDDDEEENDQEQPLDLGSSRPPSVAPPSARSRDHPEIVSILSRQPKNVVMMGPDLRKFVGLDAL